jgi:hypothetical protein
MAFYAIFKAHFFVNFNVWFLWSLLIFIIVCKIPDDKKKFAEKWRMADFKLNINFYLVVYVVGVYSYHYHSKLYYLQTFTENKLIHLENIY